MKKKSQTRSTPKRLGKCFGIFFALLVTFSWSFQARAGIELDREYSLESVGYLDPWDNIDGLLNGYMVEAYQDFFDRTSWIQLRDLSEAQKILKKSAAPYFNLIQDEQILAQIARAARVETLLRTKIYREGKSYKIVIDWLHAPKMESLGTVTRRFMDPEKGMAFDKKQVEEEFRLALTELFSKVPFRGAVRGIENSWVTVNVGSKDGIQKGDTLIIGTLEDVKKHPLLNSIVSWRKMETGRVIVENVDDGLAFGKILEETEDQEIARYQKVIKVLPVQEADPKLEVTEEKDFETEDAPPRYGWASAGLWTGDFRREHSGSSFSEAKEAGGFLFGAKGQLHIWLTRRVFSQLDLGYGFFSGGHATLFQGSLGYYFLMSGDFLGPKGWVRVGYHSTAYSLTVSNTERTGSITFKSGFVGLGGDIPLRGFWGLLLAVDLGIVKQAEETGFLSGAESGVGDAMFFVGAYYKLKPKVHLRIGVDVLAHTADFANDTVSVSHRIVSVGPSLLYYF